MLLHSTESNTTLYYSECAVACCSGGKDENEMPLDVDKEQTIGISTESQTML